MMAASFAAVFVALYAAHHVADHWVQTHHQACTKGTPGRTGRIACAAHVASYTATALAALTLTWWAVDLHLSVVRVAVGLGVVGGLALLGRPTHHPGPPGRRTGQDRVLHPGRTPTRPRRQPLAGYRRLRPRPVLAHRLAVHRRPDHRRGCVMTRRGRQVTRAGILQHGKCATCGHQSFRRHNGAWQHDTCTECGPCPQCTPATRPMSVRRGAR